MKNKRIFLLSHHWNLLFQLLSFLQLSYKVGMHMTQEKMSRLQLLFEKTVADYASKIERKELQLLYLEYINFGRTQKQKQKHLRAVNH